MLKSKKTIAAIAIGLIVLLILAITFPLTPGLAMLKKQLSVCRNFDFSYLPAAPKHLVKADSDLYLGLGSVRRVNHSFEIYPVIVMREGMTWRAFCPNRDEEGFHALPLGNEGFAFTIGDCCIGQKGPYTLIFLGDHYLKIHDADVDDMFDSLDTSPIVLSRDCLGLEEDEGTWVSFYSSGRGMCAMFGGLKSTGYVFVLRDIPDDYKLTIGDQVLTKEELFGSE